MALLGAAAMIVSGILTQKTALAGIDFNTIGLLVGMMVIVAIAERSGMFQYVAIWGAKRVKASPRGLLVVLAFVTAVFSAFLDNVTTVLLIAPVTFRICQRLKLILIRIWFGDFCFQHRRNGNFNRRSSEYSYRIFRRFEF